MLCIMYYALSHSALIIRFMTGLDTNIKGMRHSGFSYNGMLLKDLQELFSTGKRAITRSSLIFREGNNFTFAFAPSFVSQ